jgi:hypothetical protein
MSRDWAVGALVSLALGCEGTSVTHDANGGSSGNRPDRGGSAGMGSGGTNPPAGSSGSAGSGGSGGSLPSLAECPTSQPTTGSPCDLEGIVCSYGDDPLASCRAVMSCSAASWVIGMKPCARPPEGYCSPERPDGVCNPLDPSGGPSQFGNGKIACVYADNEYCYCNECSGSTCPGEFAWECQPPPDDPECPVLLPNVGEPCTAQGVTCTYGDQCRDGGIRTCRERVWYPGSTSCPE